MKTKNNKIRCRICKKYKLKNDFYPSSLKDSNYMCKECFKKQMLPIHKKYNLKRKLGNPIKIKKLCEKYNFSKDVTNAIILDGIILDKEMKKRGII